MYYLQYIPRNMHTVLLCFALLWLCNRSLMNSHEVFIHIHQGCFAGTGAIVRLPQCQWSKPDGYGKISQCITTTKHGKAKTVCIFFGIYCIYPILCRHFIQTWNSFWHQIFYSTVQQPVQAKVKDTPKHFCEKNPTVFGGFPSQRAINTVCAFVLGRHHVYDRERYYGFINMLYNAHFLPYNWLWNLLTTIDIDDWWVWNHVFRQTIQHKWYDIWFTMNNDFYSQAGCLAIVFHGSRTPWWRHQKETFSELLAICAGNSPVSGDFPAQRPVTQSFDVFFDLCPNKWLSKQSWGWWFETPSFS